MLSFHGNAALKTKYVERARAHREADEIVQGTGWDGRNGCCIGCLAHVYPAHDTLARDFDVPEDLFRLADAIHEGLPGDLAKTWPERLVAAIPVGADASRVRWRFLHWLLTDPAVNPGIEHEAVQDAVRGVADLCLSAAIGEVSTEDRWSAARSAARSARSAKSVAAAWSAGSAESAARSAGSAKSVAAWSAAWTLMSEKLLTLLADTATDQATLTHEDGP